MSKKLAEWITDIIYVLFWGFAIYGLFLVADIELTLAIVFAIIITILVRIESKVK